jgi:predicted dehydrogenase
MKPLRVGIVGSGIGQAHAEGYAALPEMYDLVALCDLDAERQAQVADRFDIPERPDRLEALFDMGLDLVDISTPSALHFEQAEAVLNAGLDVVVEKPAARSLAEIDALAEAERSSGRRVCPIFQYRFGQGFQKLLHLVAKGVTGRITVATAETHWHRDRAYFDEAPWRGTWNGETGGCFTTHAIHIHDMMCALLGPVASVHARSASWRTGNETEDMGVMSLGFESGAMGTSSVTLGSRAETSRLRICFEDMVAESALEPYAPGKDPWQFAHADAGVVEEALADFTPGLEGFAGQFQRLHAALSAGAPLPVTLADARRSVELLTGAYWSVASQDAVALPIGPDHPFYGGWLAVMKGGQP